MDNTNAQTKYPFYMIGPMQNLYLMEMEYEKDMERMKEFYPEAVRQLMPHVEDFCDGLEYEGSRIYDENPDVRMMRETCEKLYEQISGEGILENQIPGEKIPEDQIPEEQKKSEIRCSAFSLNPPKGWELPPVRNSILSADIASSVKEPGLAAGLHELVSLLFADEIYRRRCRHRRCRRWW